MDFGGLVKALSSLLQGGGAQPQQPQQTFDQFQASKGFVKGSDGVYRQANHSPAPPPVVPTSNQYPSGAFGEGRGQTVVTPTNPNSGFRYQMGQHDYSNLKGQLQRVLQNSPLAQYTDNFIQAGNKYGVDPRVLVTIANNESSLGRTYPTNTNNPFGYLVNGTGVQGLANAGFKSLPHAIDALTGRFQRQPTAGYQQFYKDPTIDNLQTAYNANPGEKDTYLKNATALASQFQ